VGLKAGWLALFMFVWIVGVFLGSTYDYNDSTAGAGMAYSTGLATFEIGSENVTGNGTTWNDALMAGGLIKSNTDDVWYKILSVNSTTLLNLIAVYAETGGANQNYTMAASAGWAGTGTGGYETAPIAKMERVMQIFKSEQKVPVLGTVAALITSSDFWDVVYQSITWRWSFLEDFELFYWIFCFPFVLMGILSVILILYGILTGNLSWS